MTVPSIVHTQETTVRTPEIRSYQKRLSSRCHVEWIAAGALYRFLDQREKRDRAWDLNDCRTRAWFIRNIETGKVSVVANHCGLRWCPLCAQARANYIRHSVSEWLPDSDHPKFMTLTLKHCNDSLDAQVTRLYSCFRKLRRLRKFNSLVNGGIWFFQLCRNTQRGQWHPHLHCIVTGQYIPFKYLRHLWKEVTGDSDGADIKVVTEPDGVANEVARYASRPAKLSNFTVKVAVELYEAMHGKRLCGKWGLFTKVELSVKRNPDMAGWEKVGSWSIVTYAAKFNIDAQAILRAYETGLPLDPGITLQTIDNQIDFGTDNELGVLTIDLPPPDKLLF